MKSFTELSLSNDFVWVFFWPRNARNITVFITCEKLVWFLTFCVRRFGKRSVLAMCLRFTDWSVCAAYCCVRVSSVSTMEDDLVPAFLLPCLISKLIGRPILIGKEKKFKKSV